MQICENDLCDLYSDLTCSAFAMLNVGCWTFDRLLYSVASKQQQVPDTFYSSSYTPHTAHHTDDLQHRYHRFYFGIIMVFVNRLVSSPAVSKVERYPRVSTHDPCSIGAAKLYIRTSRFWKCSTTTLHPDVQYSYSYVAQQIHRRINAA